MVRSTKNVKEHYEWEGALRIGRSTRNGKEH